MSWIAGKADSLSYSIGIWTIYYEHEMIMQASRLTQIPLQQPVPENAAVYAMRSSIQNIREDQINYAEQLKC